MKTHFFLLAFCGLMAIATTGCYSVQQYGPTTQGHSISVGARLAEVLANLGEPDSIYKDKEVKILVYKGLRGKNILSVYVELERKDTIVILNDKNEVISVETVDVGKGMTIIAPPFLDATHPIKTTELLESPENYSTEQ
jgi:hypothetical protein